MSSEQTSAEVWAAVAAVASAITAFGAFWWQRRATLDGARPELVVEGYSVGRRGSTYILHAAKLRNVGPGVAYDIYSTVPGVDDGLTLVGGSDHVPVLAPGADAPLDLEVLDERSLVDNAPILAIRVSIMCIDRLGNVHNAHLTFLRTTMPVGFSQPIAPGIVLSEREVVVTSRWTMRLRRMLRRIRVRTYPVLRRIPVVSRFITQRDELFGD